MNNNQNFKNNQPTNQINTNANSSSTRSVGATRPVNPNPGAPGYPTKNMQTQNVQTQQIRNTQQSISNNSSVNQSANGKPTFDIPSLKELKIFISTNGNLTIKSAEKRLNELIDLISNDMVNLTKKVELLTVRFNESEKNAAASQIQFKNRLEKLQDEAQKKIELKIQEINDSQKQELAEFKKKALEKEMVELLNINDQFEFALSSEIKNEIVANYVSGFRMINNMLTSWMESLGVKIIPINPGDNFDETKMNSIDSVPSDFPMNCIVSVPKKGYMMNGKVIRHASVIISNGKK